MRLAYLQAYFPAVDIAYVAETVPEQWLAHLQADIHTLDDAFLAVRAYSRVFVHLDDSAEVVTEQYQMVEVPGKHQMVEAQIYTYWSES